MAKRRRRSRRKGIIKKALGWLSKGLLLLIAVLLVIILLLRWVPVPTSSIMLQQSFAAWQDPHQHREVRYWWVDWEEMPKHAPLAVIAAEDQRFPDHWGLDIKELQLAIEQNGARGASTITQQVAKNLFLWSGRSYVRKAIEAGITLMIEALWPKQRILEVYLNIAQFGDGIYGLSAASMKFFHSDPSKMSRNQSALLAAVLPNPLIYKAAKPNQGARRRQRWILQQMQQLGGTKYLERL
ncbi:MAG: monofunctional biosynthetic peptidoglycan transglycosylase [Pseudomonadota bacterium]